MSPALSDSSLELGDEKSYNALAMGLLGAAGAGAAAGGGGGGGGAARLAELVWA